MRQKQHLQHLTMLDKQLRCRNFRNIEISLGRGMQVILRISLFLMNCFMSGLFNSELFRLVLGTMTQVISRIKVCV